MSSVLTLEVESRDPVVKKVKDVRKSGKIPAVFYGKGKKNIPLQMDYQTFRRLYRIAGDSSLVELSIDGKEKEMVLIHDYERHPVTDLFTHVDFLHVRMDEEIETAIHLEFIGVAPAVKDFGGILAPALHEVEVKCLPKDMPHHIEVDISGLMDFHASIHVKDLVIPSGVQVLIDPEVTVVSVAAPREEKEEEILPPAGAEGTEEAAEGSEGAKTETKEEGGEAKE